MTGRKKYPEFYLSIYPETYESFHLLTNIYGVPGTVPGVCATFPAKQMKSPALM